MDILGIGAGSSGLSARVLAVTVGLWALAGCGARPAPPPDELAVTGAFTGKISPLTVICPGEGDVPYWRMSGPLNGHQVQLNVGDRDMGPGRHEVASGTGSKVIMGVDNVAFAYGSGGSLTVDADSTSGSLDVDLIVVELTEKIHISGPWRCPES